MNLEAQDSYDKIIKKLDNLNVNIMITYLNVIKTTQKMIKILNDVLPVVDCKEMSGHVIKLFGRELPIKISKTEFRLW